MCYDCDHSDECYRGWQHHSRRLPQRLRASDSGKPGTICNNYLGDPGGSPAFNTTAIFSVDVPANQTLVVVVQEANLGQPAGSAYTVQVSGLVGNGRGPGLCPPIANLVSAASRVTQGGAGSFDINMPLTGRSGIEDRIASNYTAVFTFDIPVTSGTVTVTSGTATVGAITFSGNEMRANLSGVADVQNVVLHTENINGDGLPHGDVRFGFLAGDVTGNRVVDKPDQIAWQPIKGESPRLTSGMTSTLMAPLETILTANWSRIGKVIPCLNGD